MPWGLHLPLQIPPETSVLCLRNRGWGDGVRTPKRRRLAEPLIFSSLFWSSPPSLPLLQPQRPDPVAHGLWHGGLLLLGAPRRVLTSSYFSKEPFFQAFFNVSSPPPGCCSGSVFDRGEVLAPLRQGGDAGRREHPQVLLCLGDFGPGGTKVGKSGSAAMMLEENAEAASTRPPGRHNPTLWCWWGKSREKSGTPS